MTMPNYIHPLQQHQFIKTKQSPQKNTVGKEFKQLLTEAQQVTVSKHAQTRLEERGIHLDNHQWNNVSEKMQEAKQKGVTDAVVIVDDVTFIASTKNNTIITALHRDDTNQQIFTNINGTIIL